MVNNDYIPEQGDVVWLDFYPQSGHEQSGRRPGLVISNTEYNRKSDLAIFCPVTTQIKGYPFEVILPKEGKITGVILSDQAKSLDWKYRNAEFITKVSLDLIQEVLKKLSKLLFTQ